MGIALRLIIIKRSRLSLIDSKGQFISYTALPILVLCQCDEEEHLAADYNRLHAMLTVSCQCNSARTHIFQCVTRVTPMSITVKFRFSHESRFYELSKLL